ncbi:MAG TPA: hypothetical protein VFA65_06600, partial [Bryobacteraceae bacterium]|nr:hypothetical protein [Bryobacteraceae bacterium]
KRFQLLLNGSGQATTTGDPIIVENVGGAKREFPLPQSSRTEWVSKRAAEARSSSREEIHEEIGPYQVEGDRLWFGKTFYNSEGSTGVGGFGYFDVRSRSYKLLEPREVWDWAISALLVEPDAIWLGLVHYGEGADISGGLLRWDRVTATARHYDLKAELHQIMRWGDDLYLATGDGIEVLRAGRIDRYIVDSMPNGKFHVVECEGGYR